MYCHDCGVWSAPSRSDEEHASSRTHHQEVTMNSKGVEDRRKRTYRLKFDNREDELIVATSSAEATMLRDGGPESRMPYQIVDETAMADWIADRAAHAAERLALSTPLRDRIHGTFELDEPKRTFVAKEL
jgi:hypothetical protein